MNHSEIKKLFEEKIDKACAEIKNTKNGDMLQISKFSRYVDDNLVEKNDYDGKSSTSIVVSAEIHAKGFDDEESPSYILSLLCDVKGGEAKNPAELVKELENFEIELQRFIKELSSCESVVRLIQEEDERITAEGEKIVAKANESIAKMKKIGIIGIAILAVVLIVSAIIK